MKDLVKYIAQALVDNPDAVAVSEIEGEQTSVIELRVAKEDLGKIIGKHGSTDIGVYSSFTTRKGNDVLWHPDRKFYLVGKKITPDFLADLKVPQSQP